MSRGSSRIPSSMHIAIQDLWVNRSRSAIVMTTMAVAVTIMVIANLLIDSMLGLSQRQALDLRMRLVQLVPNSSVWIDGIEFPTGDTVRFSASDVAELRTLLGAQAEHVGWVDSSGSAMPLGDTVRGVVTYTVFGDPSLAGFEGIVPAAFRDHAADGTADTANEIPVLISGALHRLIVKSRGVATSVGERFVIGEQRWRIAGVADDANARWSLRAWLPATEAALERRGSSLVVLAPQSEQLSAVARIADRVERWLDDGAGPHRGGVTVWARGVNQLEAQSTRAQLFRAVLSTFALLCIILAAAGVAAVQLAGLPARIREIGVRRAVGARRGDISREVVSESALIGLGGSTVGVVAGIAMTAVIVRVLAARSGQPLDLELRGASFVLPVLVGVSAALLSALWPARRASRVDPVTALRHE